MGAKKHFVRHPVASFFLERNGSQLSFPGAEDIGAEFPEKLKKIGGIKLSEGVASGFMLSLLAAGYFLAKKNK